MRRAGGFRGEDLPGLPDWGLRAEVLEGRWVLAPPAGRHHDRAVHQLATCLRLVVPPDVMVSAGRAVLLPGGDAAVPDLVVTTGGQPPGPVPVSSVHTAVEVVGADGRFFDQVYKPRRYAEAGVPCCWRVQLVGWPGYRGLLPLVVARLRQGSGWAQTVAAAGRVHDLPVAYRRAADGSAVAAPLSLDPRQLSIRSAAGR